MPLLLPLGRLAGSVERVSDPITVLWDALRALLSGAGGMARPDLGAALDKLLPHSVLLFDGLDELSANPGVDGQASPRHCASRAIKALARHLPQTPIVVTCRVLPYRTVAARDDRSTVSPDAEPWQFSDEDGWDEREAQPFSYGQVRRFVERWCCSSYRNYPAGAAQGDGEIGFPHPPTR